VAPEALFICKGKDGNYVMDNTIVVSLIAFAGTLAGTFGGIITSNKLTNYRIEQLERKVQTHNNLIDRTYKLEEACTLQDEKIRVANHRIDDLEKEKEKVR
jgi:hypothetical protein